MNRPRTCPHDTLRVRGPALVGCYFCCKARLGLLETGAPTTAGGLSDEQRRYVGLCGLPEPTDGWHAPHFHSGPTPTEEAWDRRRTADPEILRYLLSQATAARVVAAR